MGADRPPAAAVGVRPGGWQPPLPGAGPVRRRRRAGALPVLRLQADGGHGRPEPARAERTSSSSGRESMADGRLVDEGGWPVADLLWHRSPFVGPTIWEALRFPLGTLEDELSRAAARAAADGGRAATATCWPGSSSSRLATRAGRPFVGGRAAARAAGAGRSRPLAPARPGAAGAAGRGADHPPRPAPGGRGPHGPRAHPPDPCPGLAVPRCASARSRPWCRGSRPSRPTSTPVPA